MKNILIFLLGAVVGGLACILIASVWFTGIGSGVCLAVEAAKEQGLITAAQVDQVLNATFARRPGRCRLPHKQT